MTHPAPAPSPPVVLVPEGERAVDAAIEDRDEGDPSGRDRMLRNVTVPTLTPYLPEPSVRTGTGVVVVPGGALHFLAVDNEGTHVAERLAERGIAAFVLRYRLAPTPVDEAELEAAMRRTFAERSTLADISRERRAPALADGSAALRTVRERADGWGVDPERVGMLGFSAGAFVTLVTTLDGPAGERPSFVAPVYPAWWDDVTVPVPAPPMFLAWATDDGLGDVIIDPALRIYDAWRRAGAAVEAHAYSRGGHGFGSRAQGTTSDHWFDAFVRWTADTVGA
ncbi:alpha/beta hydrolase [Sanguibacter suaedae]|uniref:Alpha/beta hydrolase fold domain-containing protein n=1 Tax=Sanguibacter suaedae TaxID=2795737 RepID=A0A934M7S8_9MICO|nr:alpha/beta hydrolase fold domain-containing protein [Sanguibacter suaedae]MBI9115752.1 alpha/beta hydrolase fold domain-containing protein [Sanguibacter suaedae]